MNKTQNRIRPTNTAKAAVNQSGKERTVRITGEALERTISDMTVLERLELADVLERRVEQLRSEAAKAGGPLTVDGDFIRTVLAMSPDARLRFAEKLKRWTRQLPALEQQMALCTPGERLKTLEQLASN